MADDKELQLKITKYGLGRITKAMEDPSLNLSLTKIKIGTGIDGKYYEITDDMLQKEDLDLQSPIEGMEFYVYDKELLEDGLTISFHTIIPETVGGFDIIEVGLYESTSDGDKLFALSVQQPFIKPSSEYNYFISINYYMFLKNENFDDLYDRITLDVEHAQVTEADMEELMRTFLFSQENLMLQIEKNSKIIGYNRPTQILDKVNENKQTFSYVTLYKNFASVLDLVSSPNNIEWNCNICSQSFKSDVIIYNDDNEWIEEQADPEKEITKYGYSKENISQKISEQFWQVQALP